MCEYAAASDARSMHVGSYSAWLTKVKGDSAMTKWFNSSNKRYFTIDFESHSFYYSQSEDRKKISQPIPFKELMGAEQLPRPAQANKYSSEHTFGFTLRTMDRTYELYTITFLDAQHWVDALNAARDLANGQRAVPSSRDREPSRSSFSTTADGSDYNGGSDSGRSSDRGFGMSAKGGLNSSSAFQGGQIGRNVNGHSATNPPPWAPPPARPFPQVQAEQRREAEQRRAAANGAALPPTAPPPLDPAGGKDPFAALDALEELAGPPPETAYMGPLGDQPPQTAVPVGELLREARLAVTQGRAPTRPAAGSGGYGPDAAATAAGGYGPAAPAGMAPGGVPFAPPLAPQAAPAPAPLPSAAPAPAPAPPPAPAPAPFPAPAPAPAPPPAPAPAPAPQRQSAPAPAPPPPPAPAPVHQQPVPAAGAGAFGHMPPAAASAITQHNPAAESWDSDDDTPADGGPVSYRPSAAGPGAKGWPQEANPAAGWAPPPPQPPQYEVPASGQGAEASGWDSDDEPSAGAAVRAAGHMAAAEPSGWDSDEDKPRPPAARPQYDACGAPVRTAEAFVAGRVQPTVAASTGNDLDDLVGEVLAAGSTNHADGSYLVPNFHCTQCDFQVLCIEGLIWGSDVEYMFFRNNYPNTNKLRSKLHPQDVCRAYCCQCSWKSAHATAELDAVAEGLRWRQLRA